MKVSKAAIYVRELAGRPKLFVKYCEDGDAQKGNLGLLPKNWRAYLGGG